MPGLYVVALWRQPIIVCRREHCFLTFLLFLPDNTYLPFMEFTSQEKAALIGVLSAVIYADGIIDGKEIDYMGRIQYELGIGEKAIEAGLEMEPAEAFAVISAMSENKKKLAGKVLIKMAYSDKELSASEYELVTGILLRCGITPEI